MRPPDDWKTPSRSRLIGHMNDTDGNSVAVSVSRDVIIIRRAGQDIRLCGARVTVFMRLLMDAERQAEACEGPVS